MFPPSPCSTSTFPSLNAAPFGPEDVGADSGRKHILEGWVQRSLWMCFDCCPVKEFKGNYGELWSNWTGSSIGKFLLLVSMGLVVVH